MPKESHEDFVNYSLPESEHPLQDSMLRASWEKGLPKQFSRWLFRVESDRGPRLPERELLFLSRLFDAYPDSLKEELGTNGFATAEYNADLTRISQVLRTYDGPGYFGVSVTDDREFVLNFSFDQKIGDTDRPPTFLDPLNTEARLPRIEYLYHSAGEREIAQYILPQEMERYFFEDSPNNTLQNYARDYLKMLLNSGRFLTALEKQSLDAVAVHKINEHARRYSGLGTLVVLTSVSLGYQIRISHPEILYESPVQVTEMQFEQLLRNDVPTGAIERCFGYDAEGRSFLTASERKLFLALLLSAGGTVSPSTVGMSYGTLKAIMASMRKKIADLSFDILIQTIYGEGYRLYFL